MNLNETIKHWSSHRGAVETNPTREPRGCGFDPWPQSVSQGSGVAMSRVGHGRGSDLVLLWLWCRPVAIASIRPLAWDLQYASGVTLKRQEKKKDKKTPQNNQILKFI